MADIGWSIIMIGALALIILIGVLTTWKTIRDKKSGFPRVDERVS